MIKAILFDVDDTLVQTIATKIEALQIAAKELYKLELNEEELRKHWGKPYKEYMQLVFSGVNEDIDDIIKKYELYRERFPTKAYEGSLEVIHKLAKKVKVGALSANKRTLVIKDLTIAGFNVNDFFYIQTSDDTAIHKPDPRVFGPILGKLLALGISKGETIYIGDSVDDYNAAHGAGLPFYALPDRSTPKERFVEKHIDTVASFNDLLDLVR